MKNFNIEDALLNIIDSKDCVKEILENNKDKIYLYAKTIKKLNNGFELNIDSKNCIVVLNDGIIKKIKDSLNKYNQDRNISLSTVSEIRSGKKSGILFSAGVIARNDNNECLMLERDSYAPTEPNCWQFPAGRCEEIKIINTAKAEIDEEISVIDKNSNTNISLANEVIDSNSSYVEVNIYIDSLHHVKNKNFAVMDSDFNTLEQYYFAKVGNTNIDLKDNEFDRKVSFISLSMLKNNDINMINLLNKEKDVFIECFKDKKNKIKIKRN